MAGRKCQSQGIIKLNIDGALDTGKGVFGTVAVCLNEVGECLVVLAVPGIGFLSPQACQALALVHGLHFCIQLSRLDTHCN